MDKSSKATDNCSSRLQASLREPEEFCAINHNKSSSQEIVSESEICLNLLTISASDTFLKSYLWHLETIVSGNF